MPFSLYWHWIILVYATLTIFFLYALWDACFMKSIISYSKKMNKCTHFFLFPVRLIFTFSTLICPKDIFIEEWCWDKLYLFQVANSHSKHFKKKNPLVFIEVKCHICSVLNPHMHLLLFLVSLSCYFDLPAFLTPRKIKGTKIMKYKRCKFH